MKALTASESCSMGTTQCRFVETGMGGGQNTPSGPQIPPFQADIPRELEGNSKNWWSPSGKVLRKRPRKWPRWNRLQLNYEKVPKW